MKKILIALMLLTSPAFAIEGPNRVYGEKYIYTQIGDFDEELSRLCGQRLFGQRTHYKYSAYFVKDQVFMGFAKGTGWNLIDYTGARKPEFDYWFKNDGYSGCQVFKSRVKQKTNK